jgi:SagB-type dehydrogenase family enzyme
MHALELGKPGDFRKEICDAALGQRSICLAPATIVIAAVFERTTRKYGQRGIRYGIMEAGHASQNVYLQAAALQVHTVAVGAFRDEAVHRLLFLDDDEQPLYLMPVGNP